jgi:hypothetical protein
MSSVCYASLSLEKGVNAHQKDVNQYAIQGRENSEKTNILQDTHERACSQSMRSLSIDAHTAQKCAEGDDDHLAKHNHRHKKNPTHQRGAKETTPLVERNRQPPRSLIVSLYPV